MIEEKDSREQYTDWKASGGEGVLVDEKQETKPIMTDKERFFSVQSLQSQTEFVKMAMIRQMAKQKVVELGQLLQELRNFAKSKIEHPESVKHFHRTTIDSFRQIVQDGALLSRTEISKLHPERQLSPYSSSDSVMMTRNLEKYDPLNLGPGMRKGVVFVFGPELIKQDTYDAISDYPTVDSAPIDKTVSAVLVDEDQDIPTVQNILDESNLTQIKVFNRNEWLKQQAEEKRS